MSDISQEIYAAIQAEEAKGKRVTRIIINVATLEELQAQTTQPSPEMLYSPAFGIPVMVSRFLQIPFLLMTEDIDMGMIQRISKIVEKLNEAKRHEVQKRYFKNPFSAN